MPHLSLSFIHHQMCDSRLPPRDKKQENNRTGSSSKCRTSDSYLQALVFKKPQVPTRLWSCYSLCPLAGPSASTLSASSRSQVWNVLSCRSEQRSICVATTWNIQTPQLRSWSSDQIFHFFYQHPFMSSISLCSVYLSVLTWKIFPFLFIFCVLIWPLKTMVVFVGETAPPTCLS